MKFNGAVKCRLPLSKRKNLRIFPNKGPGSRGVSQFEIKERKEESKKGKSSFGG